MMNQMLCPCCRALLEQGEMQRLETLSEHVFNPNGEVSLKPSYHCSNKQCKTHRFNIVWNSDGERYGGWDSEWKERMDNFMLKGVFMTNKEMMSGFRWLSHPMIIIVMVIVFVLCIISTIAHA